MKCYTYTIVQILRHEKKWIKKNWNGGYNGISGTIGVKH